MTAELDADLCRLLSEVDAQDRASGKAWLQERAPVDPGALTVGSIITALTALIVSLIGAILGGLAGMRFHRKIDRADLGDRHS